MIKEILIIITVNVRFYNSRYFDMHYKITSTLDKLAGNFNYYNNRYTLAKMAGNVSYYKIILCVTLSKVQIK
jgi:hypothetical protein